MQSSTKANQETVIMTEFEELLDRLREFEALRDMPGAAMCDRVETRVLPRTRPTYAPAEYLNKLPTQIQKALRQMDPPITRLYEHQAEAIDAILGGKDVILEAPTASGKTACFNIPLVMALAQDPDAHALMLHPMKAVSRDQRRQFNSLARHVTGAGGRKIESWIYDGDTPEDIRKLLKENPPAVLFTNPEMLHMSFLGWHEHWDEKFLSKLRFLILDEIHEYRGYIGTNVALLLRRFLAYLHKLGAHPQLVLATATCGNPEEHAYRLTGRRCTLIRARQNMRPQRHFAFIVPEIPDFHFRNIYRLRIALAAVACASANLTCLVFCPSCKFAEEVSVRARTEAAKHGVDPKLIQQFKAGLKPEKKDEILKGLRNGTIRVVFCTNALEIGIDIPQLDVCILAGFPDSVFSAWQRVGRVGRSWDQSAYVLFYSLNNPFDQFYAENIDAFLTKPLDEIVIGIDNEEQMEAHLKYLIWENQGKENQGKLRPAHEQILGKVFYEFAASKMAPPAAKPNYQGLHIRGFGKTYTLKRGNEELGTISEVHKFREAYIGAIYYHAGQAYQVKAHEAEEILLDHAKQDLRTEGNFFTVVHQSEIMSGYRYSENLVTVYGKLTVTEKFTGYRVVNKKTNEVIDEFSSSAARFTPVRGFLLKLERFADLGVDATPESLPGLEQLIRIGVPFVIPCDRHDLQTWTNKGDATVYLYETVPGSIGIAEKGPDLWQKMLQQGIEIATKCPCKKGCPHCIVPPWLPKATQLPEKSTAIAFAERVLQLASTPDVEVFDPGLGVWLRRQ